MNTKLKFKILKGEIQEFAILEENPLKGGEGFDVSCGITAKLNAKQRLIAFENTVKFSKDDKSILKIMSVMFFEIHSESWSLQEGSDQFILEREVARHFGVITIGATRGMLIAKTSNTHLSSLVLPALNIEKIIPSNIKFPISL